MTLDLGTSSESPQFLRPLDGGLGAISRWVADSGAPAEPKILSLLVNAAGAAAGTALQQVVDQATEAGQKGLVGLGWVGEWVEGTVPTHSPTTQFLPQLTPFPSQPSAESWRNPNPRLGQLWFPLCSGSFGLLQAPPSCVFFHPQQWTRWPKPPRTPSTRQLTRLLRVSRALEKNSAL